MRAHNRWIMAGMLALGATGAQALQVTGFTPQGEVAQVRQLVAKFDGPAIVFGDARAAAPLTVSCSDAQAGKGSGRWVNDREWAFQFEADLPPGVRCTATRSAAFQPAGGTSWTGATSFTFHTGGPFVQQVRPGSWEKIDEEQVFVLRLSGPASLQTLKDHTWCSLEGVGEKVPVRLLAEAERATLLKALRLDKAAAASPLRYATLACTRRFTPASKVQLVFGKGVATPSGIANTVERRFTWEVREPFAASFSCERENAQAACLPIRPMSLAFNAPVKRQLAAQVRLKSGAGSVAPVFDPGVGEDADATVTGLQFKPPFAEKASFTIELPRGFQDTAGRPLARPDSFPLQVATGPMPPLAKFAAAPFGIVERLAEPQGPALLPVTLRQVEPALAATALAPGQVSTLQPSGDAEIIAWLRKVQRYDAWQVPRAEAARDVRGPLPKVVDAADKDWVQPRMLSLLAGQPGVKTLEVPKAGTGPDGAPRPFEVVGIPLAPGFHVVEIASPMLGQALLDARHGSPRTMHVRTSALVTNLAVHVKIGRENALAWVTTLDTGAVVPGAQVRVSDCNGRELATGTTDARGIAQWEGKIPPEAPRCAGRSDDDEGAYRQAYFVSARATLPGRDGAAPVQDLAFTWSDWHRGIEPWRFNVPTSREAQPDRRAHTIFDRTLLRAGETVSMKHLVRTETRGGFGVPGRLPAELVVTHVGSGQQAVQPLAWRRTPTGGQSAESQFAVPPAAKLGQYTVELRDAQGGASLASGAFRVEEFRLPVLEGRIAPVARAPLVGVAAVPAQVQVNYVSGGPAGQLPVRVSALVREQWPSFTGWDAFSFAPPRPAQEGSGGEEEPTAAQDTRVVADKLPVVLDRHGQGTVTIAGIPPARQPRELLLEASYADPNGEIQTLRSTQTLWPAAVVAGIKTEGWVSSSQAMRFQALALSIDGKPAPGTRLEVTARARTVTSSRKRLVGGFYAYDNTTTIKDLGTVCSGSADARGLLLCEARLAQPGEVELVATATDAAGRTLQAASTVWVTRQGELWFGGENHDRIDVLPEKSAYEPGETARLQVRMPFRQATALVAVEREGIVETQVVQLRGDDPTVSLKVQEGWGPNVYVSVLALRGRLREVPWYSFFTWGYKAPREWWQAFWFEGREYAAPSALVDLSRPAFRLGLAELRVGTRAHAMAVSVRADQANYPVRGTAKVTVSARLPNGQPAANAEVAVAAVDQALLELMPNDSWDLLRAMLQRRAWGVETSTAQMEIIGRRHYGRKAVPAGGGGGKSPTRELLDTLLLWNPRVVLDAQGQAQLTVPLNDALTSFRIVAVADAGTGLFGTGQATIRSTQDLQIISGLPPLVREDDQFRAQFTLRNTTAKTMQVEVSPRATLLTLAPQTVEIPAGEAREVAWPVTAPAQLAFTRQEAILWEIEARDKSSGARDALKARQRLLPAVPVTVQQATLVQVDGNIGMDVAPPADALAAPDGSRRGGLKLDLQPRLAEGLPGVRDWFARYPFSCLEQRASKAIGLRDAALWQTVAAQIPTYLDGDGLAHYFPPREGDAHRGSDILTAYLLAASHEAAQLNPAFAMPDAVRAPMEAGLVAFVEGRITREFWAPRKDLDVRKLAALEALSRHGKAQGRMLASLTIAPNQWPTSAVIDWLSILRRVADVPQREQRIAEATQVLKARLSYQGTRLVFSTERDDHWWWLMAHGDVNTARLLLAVLEDAGWKDDLPRLASGFIARQQRGAWHTTTANLWGGLALERFSQRFESVPVAGTTRATLGTATASVDWSRVERAKPTDTAGAAHQTTPFGAPAAAGQLRGNSMRLPWAGDARAPLAVAHQGSGKPWLTVQSLAAVDLKAPTNAGYQLKKTLTPVEQAVAGRWSRGDVLRVTLEVNASSDMTWAVLTDPVPGGATILGSGLGRDSQIATSGPAASPGAAWTAFEERSFESFRAYWGYLPKGITRVEYTLRLNNVGDFALPPSRVEAMYAPEMFGDLPNARMKVEAGR